MATKERDRAERFVTTTDDLIEPPCNTCAWYNRDATCRAFPIVIPAIVLTGENDHSKVIDGQVGDFVYKAVEVEK